jgi:hypothetical protein
MHLETKRTKIKSGYIKNVEAITKKITTMNKHLPK